MAAKKGKRKAPVLSDEQLAEVLDLLEGADSAELKLTIPDESQRSTIAALGLDPLESQIRQVFFFDTPDLALNAAGVVARARRIQGRKLHDSVVKLRPVVPQKLPAEFRTSKRMMVEVDAMPGGFVCSASMKGTVDAEAILPAIRGERPIKKLFSSEQRKFYAEHVPKGLKLNDLKVLGPIFVLKLKFWPEGVKRKLVAEVWLYPDGQRILELSTKCHPSEALQVAGETRVFLMKHGVDLAGEQQTKTKTALEFFAGEL